jgi:hypothetical protein
MFLPGPLMYYGVISLSDDAVRLLAIAGLLGPIFSGFIMTGLPTGGQAQRACSVEWCAGALGFDGTCSLLLGSQ